MRHHDFAIRPAAAAALLGLALLATGCANKVQPLYHWEGYQRQVYDYLQGGVSSPDAQLGLLQAQAEKARAGNAALPPGFRAHLGLLQLQTGRPDEARAAFLAEKQTFPESAAYMDFLIGRLEGKPGTAGKPVATPATTPSPAGSATPATATGAARP
ncbi:MAG: hypothetical protein RL722_2078 [Pseudomonadota bacterium]|jgi:hypothetical protein